MTPESPRSSRRIFRTCRRADRVGRPVRRHRQPVAPADRPAPRPAAARRQAPVRVQRRAVLLVAAGGAGHPRRRWRAVGLGGDTAPAARQRGAGQPGRLCGARPRLPARGPAFAASGQSSPELVQETSALLIDGIRPLWSLASQAQPGDLAAWAASCRPWRQAFTSRSRRQRGGPGTSRSPRPEDAQDDRFAYGVTRQARSVTIRRAAWS